jgi:hypothetical protein
VGAAQKEMTVDEAVATYRAVRIGLVALVVFLGASIITTHRHAYSRDDGWQTSISAYFYTSSHSVFIASLCAVGICLIVYRGRTTTEDALLNFSGLLAFVVGLVPTGREPLRGPGLPCDFDTALFAENGVWALLFASTIAGIAVVILYARAWVDALRQPDGRRMRILEALLSCGLLAALIVGAGYFFDDPLLFTEKAHGVAALAMFGGIILVVVHYAFYSALRPDHKGRFIGLYIGLATAMLVTVIVAWRLHVFGGADRPSHGIIAVETLLIVEFALFWLLQSFDLWKVEHDTYRLGNLGDLVDRLRCEAAAAEESR